MSNRTLQLLLTLLLFTFTGSAMAANPALCSGCHGANGKAPNPAWPSLCGKEAAYLATATKAYRSGGERSSPLMGVVNMLSDADIQALAEHYAGMSCD